MEAKVDSMLNGPGCSLMDAESLVSRLLYESKGLVKGIKNEVQRREEEARRRVRTHTVVRGECLWVIAEYDGVYGDPFLWPLLYSANRSQIKDPDLIFPGQVFDVPFDTMARDRNDARKKAMTRGPWSLYDGE
ncbi:LysM peptidoglycan-binding domain-containing protein [bacterium]|nr:LysM peptidoglycan-binding domain-containing protein [bacterium]